LHTGAPASPKGAAKPWEDLVQVALLGMLKAVERFDPERGIRFAGFATPTVVGELRRHFRDHTWPLGVPRRLKYLHVSLGRARHDLAGSLDREPTVDELARYLQVTAEEVLEVLEAGTAYHTGPIRPDVDTDHEREPAVVGSDEDELIDANDRMLVRGLLGSLAPRERTILYLRYFGGLSQREIADRLGVSQVHVWRLLRQSLQQLRGKLDDGSADQSRVGAGRAAC
jgi:RNA polymerase sigma-B factor